MNKTSITTLLLAMLVLALTSHSHMKSDAVGVSEPDDREYVYYGFSPRVNYTLAAAGQPFNDATWLTVVGYNDSTLVTVHDITGGEEELLDSFSVDRMEAYTMQLSVVEANFSIERFFKVVSDRPIAAFMYGGDNYVGKNLETWGVNLFYLSTDGGFAGKEFIFMSAQSANLVRRTGEDYVVFGVDDSDVVVQDADGKVLTTKHVAANSSKRLPFVPSRVYRIVSSGRIMMTTWSMLSLVATPSPLGGYTGKFFLAKPDQTEIEGSPVLVATAQEEPSSVQVVDIGAGSKIIDKEVASRDLWFVKREEADLEGNSLMLESSTPIIALAGSTYTGSMGTSGTIGNLANAVFFLGVRRNEPTTFYVPSRGIVFSPETGAEFEVNGIRFSIPMGSYKEVPLGTVTVVSNATLIVEVISEPLTVGESVTYMRCFGTYLITTEAVEITYPPPKPSEEGPTGGGQGLDMTLVAIAVALGVVVAVVFFMKKRS